MQLLPLFPKGFKLNSRYFYVVSWQKYWIISSFHKVLQFQLAVSRHMRCTKNWLRRHVARKNWLCRHVARKNWLCRHVARKIWLCRHVARKNLLCRHVARKNWLVFGARKNWCAFFGSEILQEMCLRYFYVIGRFY